VKYDELDFLGQDKILNYVLKTSWSSLDIRLNMNMDMEGE